MARHRPREVCLVAALFKATHSLGRRPWEADGPRVHRQAGSVGENTRGCHTSLQPCPERQEEPGPPHSPMSLRFQDTVGSPVPR